MDESPNRRTGRALKLPQLAAAAGLSTALALGLSSCTNVAGFTPTSLVRVVDASYIAPAVNVYIENTLFAGNIGQGYISNYGTAKPSPAAQIKVTQATGGATLVAAAATLNAGMQHSVFLTDNGASPTAYIVTVLEDQQTPAAAGHSAFRFLNQAPAPAQLMCTWSQAARPWPAPFPCAQRCRPVPPAVMSAFASATVTMVITPAGTVTPKFTSTSLALSGGEVRTVVIVDSQLTNDPPVRVVIAKDVD